MIYKIKYHPQAYNDLMSLDKTICNKVLKKIGQLAEKPYMGHLLGNKAGLDLTGYRKLYADKQRIRVVYRVDEDMLTVIIGSYRKAGRSLYLQTGKAAADC